jgi:hypothetical protein
MHGFFFFLSRFNVFYHHYAFSYLCALKCKSYEDKIFCVGGGAGVVCGLSESGI